ncbi:Cytohesin-1 [Desmophyllum pertusum]|uniref:Cytohesin-1 n=1 Tax=Desmophyllum pertusum TaxID=174260 RepID=A0A9X0CQW0_9CNID|nr:Cytohesin-1 [Desmophyllum pertusum]
MSTPIVQDRNDSSKGMNGLTAKEQSLLLGIRKRKSELLDDIQRLKVEIAEVSAEMDTVEQRDNGSKDDPRAKQLSTGRRNLTLILAREWNT